MKAKMSAKKLHRR